MNDTTAPSAPTPAPTPNPRDAQEDPRDATRPLFDQLLRSPAALLARFDGPLAGASLVQLALLALAGHIGYGLVVGSFSGGEQWWAAPLKIALGSLLSAALCFPSLYIFVSRSGADTSARHVLGMLLAMLASTGVLLVGFAPVAWIFSQSSTSLALLAPLHYFVWIVSLFASERILEAGLKHWRARRGGLLPLWTAIFLVTCLQMTTTLRPVLGRSENFFDSERKLFLVHWAETISDEVERKSGK
ncbi:MAG: hypothetical protein IPJ19_03390 [Planctomycetes bacterium]|nr:hypothetical protein [Planctomycetota bacterium]